MARRAGAFCGIVHLVEQPGLDEHPLVTRLHQAVRGAPWLLHDGAAREVIRQMPQLVLQHRLRMAPALVLPEQVHAHALDQDRQHQRGDQYPEQAQRQGDRSGDQALPALLLPLRSGIA